MLDNPTQAGIGAVCLRLAVPGGRPTDVGHPAWAIQCEDRSQYSYYAHTAGLDEVYWPTNAGICQEVKFLLRAEVKFLLRASCVDGCRMDEWVLVTMFTDSFGDRSRSPYKAALSALLTKEDMTWQALMSQLMQENSSKNAIKSASYASKDSPYIASSNSKKIKKQ